MKKSRETT